MVVAAARCPRPRRNLIRVFVFVAAVVALLMYLRRFQRRPHDEEEVLMEGEEVMKMYLQDRKGWLERKIREYERRVVWDLGQDGEPASLEGEEKELGEKALKKIALNTVLCDRVPLNRTLKDPRNKG